MEYYHEQKAYRVSIVQPDVSDAERERIMAQIHDIALEIALGCEEEDELGLLEVRVG